MMQAIKDHLAGWSIPLPSEEQLTLMISAEERFVEQHNHHYEDTIDKEDSYVLALAIAYRLWSIRATTASSSKGAVSISSSSLQMMDSQMKEQYRQIFAKRFSSQAVCVV